MTLSCSHAALVCERAATADQTTLSCRHADIIDLGQLLLDASVVKVDGGVSYLILSYLILSYLVL